MKPSQATQDDAVQFMAEHHLSFTRYDAGVKLGIIGEVSTVTGPKIMFLTDEKTALEALDAYTAMMLGDLRSTVDKKIRRRRRI